MIWTLLCNKSQSRVPTCPQGWVWVAFNRRGHGSRRLAPSGTNPNPSS